MFGKTRLGKSNVVKLVAQSLIETTETSMDVGQIIFDINGEYANDNPQDNEKSIATSYPKRCVVYALSKKEGTQSKELKINFYESPKESHKIIRTLLREAGRGSIYIERFLSVDIPSIEHLKELNKQGTTIIYTSHHLDEAEHFCTQVAIIDYGKIITQGTPAELITNTIGATNLEQVFLNLTNRKLRD